MSASDISTETETEEESWARTCAMTDEEVGAAALSDPDAQPATAEALALAFRPGSLRRLRESLALSQSGFADRYGLNVRTLQKWEAGRGIPDQAVLAYLRVIAAEPDLVARALRNAA